MVREESLTTVFEVLTSNGLPQAEFTKAMGLKSRDASRICRRLERDGLIVRQRFLFNGRFTFMLKATSALTLETLRQRLTRKPIQPNMNFVAPDLTPRTKEAVTLRKKGLTSREIAAQMHIGVEAVHMYLHDARRPDQYYLRKEKAFEQRYTPDPDALSFVLDQLKENGYLCTTDLKGLDKNKFRVVAEHLQRLDKARIATFPHQWKFFGTLADQVIVYVDSPAVAEFIYSKLELVLKDWKLRTKRGLGGEGYTSLSHFRSGVSSRLRDVLPNSPLYNIIRDKMSRAYEY